MTKSRNSLDLWLDRILGIRQLSPLQTSVSGPVPTPSERKADQTAQVARAIAEAEKEQRQANKARLRQARLEKEAQDRAGQALSAPKWPDPR